MDKDTYVYCTKCKWFRLFEIDNDDFIPCCINEEMCNLWNCEDSKPFKERPHYEPRIDNA